MNKQNNIYKNYEILQENISTYLTSCGSVGLSEGDRFQTVDLYEGKDMLCVSNNFHSTP
jgi:hypothetical protein